MEFKVCVSETPKQKTTYLTFASINLSTKIMLKYRTNETLFQARAPISLKGAVVGPA